MTKKHKTIHDFTLELICDFFNRVERQGPGSVDVTQRALSFIEGLPINAKIADIGCGSGGQTITLAQNTTGHITAIDLFPGFIETLNRNIIQRHYQDRISTLVASMETLPFHEEELDLIWAEGSIYNIGFERGLKEWKRFLKPNGYIAVSEGTWFTNERPKEIERYWMDHYPEIDVSSNKVKQMEQAGYTPVAHFILPVNCWEEHFHVPIINVMEQFLQDYNYCKEAVDFIESQRNGIDLYRKYHEYYGYTFYIGQRNK